MSGRQQPWARVLGLGALLLAGPLRAQEPRPVPAPLVGEVIAADPAAGTLSVRSDTGATVPVRAGSARVLRTAVDATDLKTATPYALDQVARGDRVLVRGTAPAEGPPLEARLVVVMTAADVQAHREAELAAWKGGVLGVVAALGPAAGEITLRVRGRGAPRAVVVTAGPEVPFRRYAPDSVRFADTRPSRPSEVRVGDQLRARGIPEAEGGRFTAAEVVFGTFRTLVGSLTRVDPAAGQISLRDEVGGKLLAVRLGPGARIARLPAEMAAFLFHVRNGEAGPPAAGPPPGPGGGGMGRGGNGRGAEDILDRLPAATLADLRAGERVVVCATEGGDPALANGVALVAGLPPPAANGRRGERPGGEGDMPAEFREMGLGGPES